jgi:hypothetical protein
MAHHWIDVHAHFTPPTTREECEARWKTMRDGLIMIPESYEWIVESTLDYMDRAGIQMQLLSNVPKTLDKLRASNDYSALLVSQHPSRFGLLAALPTDDPQAALAEIERAANNLYADGYAVTCHYNEVYLSDPSLEPVWAELDRRCAVVFVHPDAYAPASLGRPTPLLEVAFETTRTLVDMLYTVKKKRRIKYPLKVYESATYNKPFSPVYHICINCGINDLKKEYGSVHEHQKTLTKGLLQRLYYH